MCQEPGKLAESAQWHWLRKRISDSDCRSFWVARVKKYTADAAQGQDVMVQVSDNQTTLSISEFARKSGRTV